MRSIMVPVFAAGGVALWAFVMPFVTGFTAWQWAWWAWARDYYFYYKYPPLIETVSFFVAVLAASALWSWIFGLTVDGRYGSAEWGRAKHLKRIKRFGLTLSKEILSGVVLGRFGSRLLYLTKPLTVIAMGPTRSGKSAGVLKPTILSLRDVGGVVYDPAGDISAETIPWREKVAARSIGWRRRAIAALTRRQLPAPPAVHLLDWGNPNGARFNPVARRNIPTADGPRGTAVDRFSVAVCQTAGEGGGSGDFFDSGASAILSAVILFNVYEEERKGRDTTISDCLRWWSNLGLTPAGEKEDSLSIGLLHAAQYAENQGMPRRVADQLRRFAAQDAKLRSNFVETMNVALQLFSNSDVEAVTSSSTFSLDELRAGAWLYVSVKPRNARLYAPITRYLVDCCYHQCMDRLPSRREKDVWFLLDEIALLPRLDAVIDGPAQAAKYGLGFVFGFQDRKQLELVYGRERTSSLFTNVVATVVFQQECAETAKWVEEHIGNTSTLRVSEQEEKAGDVRGRGRQQEGVPLLSQQDVMNLLLDEAVVLLRNLAKRPFRVKLAGVFGRPFKRRWAGGAAPRV